MITQNSQDIDRQIKLDKDNIIGDEDNQTHMSSRARKNFKDIKSTLWPSSNINRTQSMVTTQMLVHVLHVKNSPCKITAVAQQGIVFTRRHSQISTYTQ